MQKLTTQPRAGDHLLAALEACCEALRSLEVASALAAQEEDENNRQEARALEHLREAISEIHALQHLEPNVLAGGFVLPGSAKSGVGNGG
jgi:hypothetical protein